MIKRGTMDKGFMKGLRQDRDEQAHQDQQTAGEFIEAHLFLKDDHSLQRGAERTERAHHPGSFRCGPALSDRLKGETESAADHGKGQYHGPFRTGLREPGLFKDQGEDQ